jgi:TonB family protein
VNFKEALPIEFSYIRQGINLMLRILFCLLFFVTYHSEASADYKNPLPLCNESASVWSLCNGQRMIGNGEIYKGAWFDNKPHGLGEIIGSQGQILRSGIWDRGSYVGQETVPQDFPQCTGDQSKWNLCKGRAIIDDNLVYEGTWIAGKPHGAGRSLTSSGAVISKGIWHQGRYIGAEQRPVITTTTVRPPPIPSSTNQAIQKSGDLALKDETKTPQSRVAPVITRSTCKSVPYPPQARRHDAQGVVGIIFTSNDRGHIIEVAVEKSSGESPGHKELDKAALEIVGSCIARPGLIDGKPATMSGRIEWIFRLE